MSSLPYDLTLAGLAVGSAAALTGIGLVVTYRATGVLNFAHGAIAMVGAYALRQSVVEWGWPLWLAAAVTLLVLAPGLVTRVPAYERARRGLCLVPERQAVFGSLTVRDNLELAAPDHGPALDASPQLRPLLERRAGTLSGGEQRMLALSRALLARARLVLVDEPAQGMSSSVAARTYELLSALDACVVTAEQRLPPALRDRQVLVYELRRGTLVFAGEASELRP